MEKIYLVVDGSQAAPNIRHALLSDKIPMESIIEAEQSDPHLFDKISADSGVRGIIVSGSPRSVNDVDATHLDPRIYDFPIPKLLICYAFQDAAHQLGGIVAPAATRENGTEKLILLGANPLITSDVSVISNHGDEVLKPWPDAVVIAKTDGNANAAAFDAKRKIIAVQPHFEISDESVRRAFFHNFRNWTGFAAERDFSPEAIAKYVSDDLAKNHPLPNGRRVMVALSGGVDSTALAAALDAYYGRENVCKCFVDTGLLRYDYDGKDFGKETDRLISLLEKQFGRIDKIDARERFIDALARADSFDNPATNLGRRQIIGNLFADIFADFARDRGDIEYFFQGTNQADKQESGKGKGKSGLIKTHHNEVPYLREALLAAGVKIVEPLDWLYKDNIIALGRHLGLNMELYKQPPFPGPGMAVRIDGEITAESLDRVCKADAIFRRHLENAMASGEIKPANEGFKTRQYFAALLNADRSCAQLIDGAASPEMMELWKKSNNIVAAGVSKSGLFIRAPYCAIMNNVKTTGQKGDGRMGGWQVEMRLFDKASRPVNLPESQLRDIARDLLKLHEITRVSLALNYPQTARRTADGRMSAKVELTAIETRDFSSLRTMDIPQKVWDEVGLDLLYKQAADYITRAVGEKPGMTTERH